MDILAPASFIPSWDETISSEKYHSDKTSVSSTGLRKILKSPKAFHSYFIEGQREEETTTAMRFGLAVHMALLEPTLFNHQFVISPEFKGIGMKAKKEEWLSTLKEDAIVLTETEYRHLQGMIESVLKHSDAYTILKNGKPEITGYYRDEATGLRCKIRPDFLHLDLMALVDVKTCQDISMKQFSKTIWERRYDFQMAMYCEGVRLITGKTVEYPLYIALEKHPPYECGVYIADAPLLEKGMKDYRRALDLLLQCIEGNQWLPYQEKVQSISLPFWAFSNE